jgi:hypothetical protein
MVSHGFPQDSASTAPVLRSHLPCRSQPRNFIKMARYSAFLGRRVEVQYRAGDILLPAIGTFVADSGRSIFLEHHYVQREQQRQFRWEIPYRYIVRLTEVGEGSGPSLVSSASAGEKTDTVLSRDSPKFSSNDAGNTALMPDANRDEPINPCGPEHLKNT